MSTVRTCGAAEIHASHEVMKLVRGSPMLSYRVVQLRGIGMSWCDVKAAIEVEIGHQKPVGRNLKHRKSIIDR